MESSLKLLALTGCSILLAVAPATAEVVNVTYSGTVSSGYDLTGVFGPANSLLGGGSFTARYTYDTTIGDRVSVPGLYDELFGGAVYATSSPISVVVTVDGRSVFMDGAFQSVAIAHGPLVDLGSLQDYVVDYYNGAHTSIFYQAYNTAYSIDQSSLEAAVPQTDVTGLGSGYVGFFEFNYDEGVFNDYAYAYLNPTSVEVDAAVPELGSWCLMLMGLGAVGAHLRRRRRSAIS